MGYTGSIAVVRRQGAIEEVSILAAALERPPYEPVRRGSWWVVPVEEADLEDDLQ